MMVVSSLRRSRRERFQRAGERSSGELTRRRRGSRGPAVPRRDRAVRRRPDLIALEVQQRVVHLVGSR